MNTMFQEELASIPSNVRAQFNLTYDVAERLDSLLTQKGITQRALAQKLGKRESEVSRWLTGRHNFTLHTIALIEDAIGEKLIEVTN